MFTLQDVVQPNTLAEAYNILVAKRSNAVLGGCAFLRLGEKRIGTAIDLSHLNLNCISDQGDCLEIGAMTTFRELETNTLLRENFGGIVPKAVGNIIGVQFRNVVTVGASVFARYGFSDLLTALLVLDAEVELVHGGRMPLAQFLDKPFEKDILARVYLKKDNRQAAYHSLRNSASDYPIVNVAVSCLNNQWALAVGARPLKAKLALQAAGELAKGELTMERIENAAKIASEELEFGTNTRGSAAYRRAVAEALLKRAITEVAACK